jgi:hypothetical protein
MKCHSRVILAGLHLALSLAAPADQFGDFTYTSNGFTITITEYTGAGGAVTIPDTIAGLPVTTIGAQAFYNIVTLTSITIPDSVTSIGGSAFNSCAGLTRATIGAGVASIGSYAFWSCTALANVSIGSGITTIGDWAFYYCTSLRQVYFTGNAPTTGPSAFQDANNAVLHRLPGTAGWGATLAGRPVALWQPVIASAYRAAGTNGFALNVSWAAGRTVVVEVSSSLAAPSWLPLRTNALPAGALLFNDPGSTNHRTRYYRIGGP